MNINKIICKIKIQFFDVTMTISFNLEVYFKYRYSNFARRHDKKDSNSIREQSLNFGKLNFET